MAQEQEKKTAGEHRAAATAAQANGDGANDPEIAAAYYAKERRHEAEADRLETLERLQQFGEQNGETLDASGVADIETNETGLRVIGIDSGVITINADGTWNWN